MATEMSLSPSAALCLPEGEISALLRGRTVATLSATFLIAGRVLALYPVADGLNSRSQEWPYRVTELPDPTIAPAIRAIAICHDCQIIEDISLVDVISSLTIWSSDFLTRIIIEQGNLFLTGLRVFRLEEPHLLAQELSAVQIVGRFTRLPQPFLGRRPEPVLSESIFKRRVQQLRACQPPEHPELEFFYDAMVALPRTELWEDIALGEIDRDLRVFLGWQEPKQFPQFEPWMTQISRFGASGEGNQFERLVRQALVFIGFSNRNRNSKASLDPEGVGGAGGLDFFCEKPYLVIGECKASSRDLLPDSVFSQLVHLGLKHLSSEIYENAVKLVISVGRPNAHAHQTAVGNHMNLIKPSTLERLVKLKALYPGSLDLWELKRCLVIQPFSYEADEKINRLIDRKLNQLQIRSHVVECFKKLLETGNDYHGIETVHGAYVMSQPPSDLKVEELHEVAVELASPLTGYLSRERGRDWRSDRFSWLRNLSVELI